MKKCEFNMISKNEFVTSKECTMNFPATERLPSWALLLTIVVTRTFTAQLVTTQCLPELRFSTKVLFSEKVLILRGRMFAHAYPHLY